MFADLARRDLAARRVFETLAITGVLAMCAIVELGILYSVRNLADHARLKSYLHEQCVWLETSDDVLTGAVDLRQDLLAAGLHRKPIPGLIISTWLATVTPSWSTTTATSTTSPRSRPTCAPDGSSRRPHRRRPDHADWEVRPARTV